MGVEFPSHWSVDWLFHSNANVFKSYVAAVCRERGYPDGESREVQYSAREIRKGNLNFHQQMIFKKFDGKLSGYARTKRWAQTAADTICPYDEKRAKSINRTFSLPMFAILMFQGMQVLWNQQHLEQQRYIDRSWEITAAVPAITAEDGSDLFYETGGEYASEEDYIDPFPAAYYYDVAVPVAYP